MVGRLLASDECKAKIMNMFTACETVDDVVPANVVDIELAPGAQCYDTDSMGLHGTGKFHPRGVMDKNKLTLEHVANIGRHGGRRLYAAGHSPGFYRAIDYFAGDVAVDRFVHQEPHNHGSRPTPDTVCRILVVCIRASTTTVPYGTNTADSEHTIQSVYPSPDSGLLSGNFGPAMSVVWSTKYPETWTLLGMVTFKLSKAPPMPQYRPSAVVMDEYCTAMNSSISDFLGIIGMTRTDCLGDLAQVGGLLALVRWILQLVHSPPGPSSTNWYKLLDNTCVSLSRMIAACSKTRVSGAIDNGLWVQLLRLIPANALVSVPLLRLIDRFPQKLPAAINTLTAQVIHGDPEAAANSAVAYSHCFRRLGHEYPRPLLSHVLSRLEQLADTYVVSPADSESTARIKAAAFVVPALHTCFKMGDSSSIGRHIRSMVSGTILPCRIVGFLRCFSSNTSLPLVFTDRRIVDDIDTALSQCSDGGIKTDLCAIRSIVSQMSPCEIISPAQTLPICYKVCATTASRSKRRRLP